MNNETKKTVGAEIAIKGLNELFIGLDESALETICGGDGDGDGSDDETLESGSSTGKGWVDDD
jgi:hypothetical protein